MLNEGNVKQEWFYEDFYVGQRFKTRQRVLTGTEMDLYPLMAGVMNLGFFSDEEAKKTGRQQRWAWGPIQLMIAIGLTYQLGILDKTHGLIGFDKIRFFQVAREGDCLVDEVEIMSKEKYDDEVGILKFKHHLNKCDGTKMMEAEQLAYVFFRKGNT